MKELRLSPGDIVMINGEKCRTTVFTVQFGLCATNHLQINRPRSNNTALKRLHTAKIRCRIRCSFTAHVFKIA